MEDNEQTRQHLADMQRIERLDSFLSMRRELFSRYDRVAVSRVQQNWELEQLAEKLLAEDPELYGAWRTSTRLLAAWSIERTLTPLDEKGARLYRDFVELNVKQTTQVVLWLRSTLRIPPAPEEAARTERPAWLIPKEQDRLSEADRELRIPAGTQLLQGPIDLQPGQKVTWEGHEPKSWIESLPEKRLPGCELDLSQAAREIIQMIKDHEQKG